MVIVSFISGRLFVSLRLSEFPSSEVKFEYSDSKVTVVPSLEQLVCSFL